MKQSILSKAFPTMKMYLCIKEGSKGINTFVDDKIYSIYDEHKQQLVTFLSNIIVRLDNNLAVVRQEYTQPEESKIGQDRDTGSK